MDFQRYADAVGVIIRVSLGKKEAIERQGKNNFYPSGVDCLTTIEGLGLSAFVSFNSVDADDDISITVADKQYAIKKEDRELEDPAVYTPEGDLISNSSYTFVLIELAIWLSKKTDSKIEHRRFDIYYSIRNNFNTLIKDKYYSNKLWLKDSEEAFVVTIADIMIIIVGRSKEALTSLLPILGVELKDN
ncbi:hypothetical protein [Niabella terrae]